MSDIATHAGVSPTTVSFVLNDPQQALRISEKTRLKVLQSAETLGYRSNQLARAMRTGNSQTLGVLGGYMAGEQVGKMLTGALEAADAQGYTLKLLRLDAFGSAQQVIRRISELRLMGMLAFQLPDAVLGELYIEAREYNTPLVLMDARCENPEITQVVSDDKGGIVAGVDHLAKLGHARIAFIGGEDESILSAEREAAFRTSMKRHRFAVPADYVQEGSFGWRLQTQDVARKLLTLPAAERPTAIICSGDLIALAVLQLAYELKLHVPHDLSVIGFANLTVCEYSTPSLTTIEQPYVEMGRTAVNMLLDAIGGESNAEGEEPKKICRGINVLPTQLVERDSTAPPRDQTRRNDIVQENNHVKQPQP